MRKRYTELSKLWDGNASVKVALLRLEDSKVLAIVQNDGSSPLLEPVFSFHSRDSRFPH